MHVYFRQGFAHHHHRADRHPIFYERVEGRADRPTGPLAPDGPDAPSSTPAAARARAPRVRGAGGGIILVSNRLMGGGL